MEKYSLRPSRGKPCDPEGGQRIGNQQFRIPLIGSDRTVVEDDETEVAQMRIQLQIEYGMSEIKGQVCFTPRSVSAVILSVDSYISRAYCRYKSAIKRSSLLPLESPHPIISRYRPYNRVRAVSAVFF